MMFESKKIEGLCVVVLAFAVAYIGTCAINAFPLKGKKWDVARAAQIESEMIQSEVK